MHLLVFISCATRLLSVTLSDFEEYVAVCMFKISIWIFCYAHCYACFPSELFWMFFLLPGCLVNAQARQKRFSDFKVSVRTFGIKLHVCVI